MTNLSRIWRCIPVGFRSAGLNLGRHGAVLFAARQENAASRACWFELVNKITAYRLFENGAPADRSRTSRLDAYSRLFAAEGYGYRNGLGALTSEIPASLCPIAVHAGVGLQLAERTLVNINSGKCERDLLAEFLVACRQVAGKGFSGIMEESLGLVTRTLYPHLLARIDKCLQAMSALSRERFWHGVGRGIYFLPCNIPPSRAAPWQGLAMCLQEPPNKTGKRNAIAGFCFALTLVNLRRAEVFTTFFQHHQPDVTHYGNGIYAALAVWKLAGGKTETAATDYCCAPELLFSALDRREEFASRVRDDLQYTIAAACQN